jgi:16S rRNA (uracil1498-N3)-methyltransferase
MDLPFFYLQHYNDEVNEIEMDETTSAHIAQVLRMKKGDQLKLTNGKGIILTCSLSESHKKHSLVKVEGRVDLRKPAKQFSIAVSLLKNTARFEWFLEKATELGINRIIPLITGRTIREKFRYDRMHQITVSAMLQSQQAWLPVLEQPCSFNECLRTSKEELKLIAHCEPAEKEDLHAYLIQKNKPATAGTLIAIGPEGDFTSEEIQLALDMNFIAVSLGTNRLRTETAALVAAVLLSQSH